MPILFEVVIMFDVSVKIYRVQKISWHRARLTRELKRTIRNKQ